jgi:hypothetical protein
VCATLAQKNEGTKVKITWMDGSAFNFGRIEGTDYRCERFSRPDGSLWFLLSSPKKTYLCCKGPFQTKEERDLAIINKVKEYDRA